MPVELLIRDYLPLLILIAVSAFIAGIVPVLAGLLGPNRPSATKNLPYESGMMPVGPGTRRVPVRFYLVAVLFILFDIEVMFILPWAVVFRDLAIFGLANMGLFLFILTIGFIYEWKTGALNWE